MSHFPARLIDVAPTVLRLLGPPRRGMDGLILADALISPTGSGVGNQDALGGTLTAHQSALTDHSATNIAEDTKGHIKPPPSLIMRP